MLLSIQRSLKNLAVSLTPLACGATADAGGSPGWGGPDTRFAFAGEEIRRLPNESRCGNARLDAGEVCDDGTENGRAGACDAECQFRCDGPCPLRVDPGRTAPGDGSSWATALTSVQEAIDAQAARGGGSVWVRGPGPFAELAAAPGEPLMELGPGVTVIGGFAGDERHESERAPGATTVLVGSRSVDVDPSAPLVVGAAQSTLIGFTVQGHGGTALVYSNAPDFVIGEVTIEDGRPLRSDDVRITNSSGTIEALRIARSVSLEGVAGLFTEGSTLRVRNSEFDDLSTASVGGAGLHASGSRLVLENVRFTNNDSDILGAGPGLLLSDSEAVAFASLWRGNRGEDQSLKLLGSRFVAFDSHFEDNFTADELGAFLVDETSHAWFVSSSFVGNRATWGGGALAVAGRAAVVSSTFLDNVCHEPLDGPCGDDIHAVGPLELFNVLSSRSPAAVNGAFTGTGNCFHDDSELVTREADGSTVALLPPESPCVDAGDSEAARSALNDAERLAAELGLSLPFETDAWWRERSALAGSASDDGALDPGRHYASPSGVAP